MGVLAPGVTIFKTLHLFNTGAGGDRTIDISIQSRTMISAKRENGQTTEDQEDEDRDRESSFHDSMEHLRMIVIPTTNPFRITHNVVYRHALGPWPSLASLETFDESFWDDRRGGEALVTAILLCVGPSSLNIESLRLERHVSATPRSSNFYAYKLDRIINTLKLLILLWMSKMKTCFPVVYCHSTLF